MRILIFSCAYPPDPASVGQHMADVAIAASRRGHSVRVITADRGYEDPSLRFSRTESVGGLRIVRLSWSSFGKRSFLTRILGQISFTLQGFIRGLSGPRPDVVLVSTTPPFGILGGWLLSLIRRSHLVYWVMDINPDQAIAMRMVSRRSAFSGVMESLNRRVLLAARTVITLDPFMARTLSLKVDKRRPISVVPPWPHEDTIARSTLGREEFRFAHRLDGKFVVMYSGNHSWVHPLDTVLEAARKLSDRKDILFLFVGKGNEKAKVDRAIREGVANIQSLPYQPLDHLGGSLAAADAHIVVMGDAMVGIVHPCKIYNAMRVNRPILALAPDRSHIAEIMDASDIGYRLRHGDSDGFAHAVLSLAAMSESQRRDMGMRAGTLARTMWNQAELMDRFLGLLLSGGRDPEGLRPYDGSPARLEDLGNR